MDSKPGQTEKTAAGRERIAKVLARRGVASRRGAEAMIAEGRVSVNGAVIASPAVTVGPKDRIAVDGRPLAEAAPTRLWLYHKPVGLVTTERDEKGRPTVFAALPPGLGRVMSVGRLDISSEGLLLLTNDGELKRRLELPSTGWLRKYRVRVNGTPADAALEPLRRGLVIEGERFLPMTVELDRQQGANAWLTVGIREGRNREVRRAMEAVGLTVNRLIRISYGPFRLGELKPGEVEAVRGKVLRDQLGLPGADAGGADAGGAADAGRRGAAAARAGSARGRAAAPQARARGGKTEAGPGGAAPPATARPARQAGGKGKPAIGATSATSTTSATTARPARGTRGGAGAAAAEAGAKAGSGRTGGTRAASKGTAGRPPAGDGTPRGTRSRPGPKPGAPKGRGRPPR